MVRSMTIDRPIVEAQPLAWLARWLDAELDAVLDSLVDGELSAIPELAVARDNPRDEIKHSVRVHLIALVNSVRQAPNDGRLTLPDFIGKHTRALARRDMPSLPALLRAFEEIHAGLWRRIAAALRDGPYRLEPEHRAEVLEVASAHLFTYFQAASTVTTESYAAERALLLRRSRSHRSQVVTGLLHGSVPAGEAEQALGYELNVTHLGYVAWVDDVDQLNRLDGLLATMIDHMRARQHLSVPAEDRVQHGWITCQVGTWLDVVRATELPTGVHCAFGAPQQGVDGFRASHADALEARRVGEATGWTSTNRAVVFDDVAVASLASRDLGSADTFVRRQLGRLAGDDDTAGRLLQTLRVYLDELASPTRTARRLHVHPNTVVKRVERIEALLGRPVDPASLSLRVAVELAPLARSAQVA